MHALVRRGVLLGGLCLLGPGCGGTKPEPREAATAESRAKATEISAARAKGQTAEIDAARAEAPRAEAIDPKAPEGTPDEANAETTSGTAGTVTLLGLSSKEAAAELQKLDGRRDSLLTLEMSDTLRVSMMPADCRGEGNGYYCSPTVVRLTDTEAIRAWFEGAIVDPPGWAVGPPAKCRDGCCSFERLAVAAAERGPSVPHELAELDKVCFEVDGIGAVTAVTHLHFLGH